MLLKQLRITQLGKVGEDHCKYEFGILSYIMIVTYVYLKISTVHQLYNYLFYLKKNVYNINKLFIFK